MGSDGDDSQPGPHGVEIERRRVTVGYVPLADCAPLAVAQRLGFFQSEGLEVSLSAEPSWANIRDKIQLGQLDAAQMLAPMPLAASLGIDGRATPMLTALTLNLNGNGITVAHPLYERMQALAPGSLAQSPVSAEALAAVIADRRARAEPPLRLATVYPFSTHAYQLRYWLSAASIDPDRDVCLRVVPPPLMATHLRAGWIDGYCVGEPWNSAAVVGGDGRTLITSHELWANGQEKVLGVTAAWAERHPNTHRALIRALLSACQWLDQSANRAAVARILSEGAYVDVSASVLERSLTGAFAYAPGEPVTQVDDLLVFHRYAANFPWRSHTLWYASQMARWGHLPAGVDLSAAVQQAVRPDLFREAAAEVGLLCPDEDMKLEGEHDAPWSLETAGGVIAMGPDRFFDGTRFDPWQPHEYLARLPVSSARASAG
ncbi:MAG: CmpA/NrtA family ABC transporter substrate-binding protein [Halofilum sp. (in: g-proteobacteria)]